jgi:Glycosyl transferase family 2
VSEAKPPILAIAAPVRGEAPYLLEWVAYHRVLGVKAFLLGDNTEADDPTGALLQALHRHHIVFRFDWRGRVHFQKEFNQQVLDTARLFADGIFLIDVDEFLRPAEGSSLLEITGRWLSDPSIGAVALNWAIYGSSNRVQAGDGLVIERFTHRAPQDFPVNLHAKPFARMSACAGPWWNPHAVALHAGRYTDTCGQDVAWDTTRPDPVGMTTKVVWDVLRVDHFVVKSHEEFLAKQARGSPMLPQRIWDGYFDLHDRNEVEDPIPAELVERTKAEMAKIAAQIAEPTAPSPAASPASQ